MIILLRVIQFILCLIFYLPAPLALFLLRIAAWKLEILSKLTPLKKMAANNVRLVLPQSPAAEIAGKLIHNTAHAAFEVLATPFFKRTHMDAVVHCVGLDNLQTGLKAGKGVILLSMHTGNYELVPPFLASRGLIINNILRATDDPVFKLINQSRATGGGRLINVLEQDMYRTALQVLAKNEIVGILVDTGALESRYVTIPFLGHKVPVATGWLTIAQRTKAAVIPVLAQKEGPENIFTFLSPLHVTSTNKEEIIRQIGAIYENFIKQHPEQWLMFLNTYETKRMVNGK